MQKYAFLDRDGTILIEPEQDGTDSYPLQTTREKMTRLRFLNDALEGLDKLKKLGFKFVLVTNQPWLDTPKRPKDIYEEVTSKMYAELDNRGIVFDFVMMCPHGPEENCECRKPKIGGLKDFLETNKGNIDFEHSLMFGDRDTDGIFADNLGVRFVRIVPNTKFEIPSDI
ncbi:MAG TPA: HAD-IIIA family hydrolase [Candidatus Saccharimonadales bacterium]